MNFLSTAARFGKQEMRPSAIEWFQRFLLSALLIDLLNNLAAWHGSDHGGDESRIAPLILGVLSPALGFILWYFVARRGSGAARWITAALVAFGTIGFIVTAFRLGAAAAQPTFLVAAAAELLKVAAVACLFSPAAGDWFSPTQQRR